MTTRPPPTAGKYHVHSRLSSLAHMADVQYLVPTLDHTMLNGHFCAVLTGTTSFLCKCSSSCPHEPCRSLRSSPRSHAWPPRMVLWGLLDSACCVVGSVYASWWITTGAHGVIAATVVDAYAVVANYFVNGCGIAVEPLESQVSDDTLVAGDMDLESMPREVEEGLGACSPISGR